MQQLQLDCQSFGSKKAKLPASVLFHSPAKQNKYSVKSLPYKIHTFLTKTAIKMKTKLSVSSKACNSLEQPRREVLGEKDIFLSIPPSKTP